MPWPTISTFSSASRLKIAVWSVEQLLVASCGEEGMRAVVSVCMQGRGASRAALRSRAVVSVCKAGAHLEQLSGRAPW